MRARSCGDALEMRGGIGYVEEFASARLLRDAHLGSIWEGTGNIVALDAITRAVGRHHAEGALGRRPARAAERSPAVPQGLSRPAASASSIARSRFAQPSRPKPATKPTRAAPPACSITRRAPWCWRGKATRFAKRGDARRLLLSQLVLDHSLGRRDAFAPEGSGDEQAIAAMLLGDDAGPGRGRRSSQLTESVHKFPSLPKAPNSLSRLPPVLALMPSLRRLHSPPSELV